jgi:hypothetical protein
MGNQPIVGIILLVILLVAGFLDKIFPNVGRETMFKISIIIAAAVGLAFVLFY